MTTTTTTTEFVPADLDARQWANLEPLYQALIDRELKCSGCLEQLLLDRSELDASASEAFGLLYIAMTCDTEDKAKKSAYLDFVENVQPKLKTISFDLDKTIASSPHRGDLDQDRYGVLLRGIEADVSIFREENVPLQTEDAKLCQQYNELCGAMMVTFRGKEYTMPLMAKFAQDNDRATREEAWRASTERRYQDHEKFDDLFDQMVKLRHQIALNAGFDNYREYMFKEKHRFDYTPSDCVAFHQGAQEVCVPLMRKLDRERAKALGVDPLRPWDLSVDVQGRDPLRPFDGADELVEKTSRLFRAMHEDLSNLFEQMRDGESLDLDSRKGKAPGGYQESLDRKRKPFIFMNAAGLHHDVVTMVHEVGHAFHCQLSRDEPLVQYRHAPMEFCEVASMSMELIAYPYLGEFYDEAEQARAKRDHLERIVGLLPWVACVDAFQHWIYANPEHSREQRTAHWLELRDRFGLDLSWEGLEHYRESAWHRQIHIFEVPFYYIEYGIAQLGALQLWQQSLESEAGAIENYQKALTLGGSKPLPELFETAGLTFGFGPSTMKSLMDEVETKLASLPA
ncbi:MAG: M3 family oligoendopeptidase [Planctomycetota bacterium]|nr:M3 family oligoendopeptidase [Planctomycetota bacterium]